MHCSSNHRSTPTAALAVAGTGAALGDVMDDAGDRTTDDGAAMGDDATGAATGVATGSAHGAPRVAKAVGAHDVCVLLASKHRHVGLTVVSVE